MSTSREDPLVDMRRLFPLGPAEPAIAQMNLGAVVPFGIRYAVPVVEAADKKNSPPPTKPRVSVNTPTSPDGKAGAPTRTDDVITEGSD
jgi:hypothetical protein